MWQTVVYVILKAIGVAVNAEVMTNEGRIDMTYETPAGIWLIEFKLGLSFSSEKRTIVDVRVG